MRYSVVWCCGRMGAAVWCFTVNCGGHGVVILWYSREGDNYGLLTKVWCYCGVFAGVL